MQAQHRQPFAFRTISSRLGLSVIACLSAVFVAVTRAGEDPFAEFIRKTEPLVPEAEQKSFHLPAGFEVQLVAAEPDISKPMNMAFDERGRLWITQSREYPYAVPTNQPGRDAIKILSDFDASGRARRITTFADGLNIPIGLYPYRGGAIAFSIPGINRFEDTDRDGRADKRTLLYGGQGYDLDTHGLTSGFRRGYDGWLYACHGYRNNTTLRGTDGHTITMNSGNIYRMRPDGSRVEQFTWGQVNPFGLMFDPLGDLFSADCHSSPVYHLLRGACYPSFGKPHDGLGYGPDICKHAHGSTAIAGIALYFADQFPAEYHGNSFIGNVMTCRINRDSFTGHGSTRIAKEEPDFLRSDDPWFRPVDLQLGPDGALYVADFYNRVIGHYEVPLDHPGRDRERGRIWRIVYHGGNKPVPLPQEFDLSQAAAAALVKHLAHANIAVRMQAMNQLVDRIGKPAIRPLEKLFRDRKSTSFQKVHGLWALHQLGAINARLLTAAARDADARVRLHAMRVLSETADWMAAHRGIALAGLGDADAYVQRAAADALGVHPSPEQVRPLLAARRQAPEADASLLHTVRMALRNQLQTPAGFQALQTLTLDETDSRVIADVSLGIKTADAGSSLLKHIQRVPEPRDTLIVYLRHAGRFAPENELDAIREIVRAKFPGDPDAQFACFQSVQDGVAKRGMPLGEGLRDWAASLAAELLASATDSAASWTSLPVKGADSSDNPWSLQRRKSADGDRDSVFLSSLPAGESLTGIIRSPPFSIPPKFSFFMAGHDGEPDLPPEQRNYVRLVDADTGEELARSAPPRNDEAQRMAWDLSRHTGRQGRLELVDGFEDVGYAWLAAGRFGPAVVVLPQFIPNSASQRQQNAAELARAVPLPQLESAMARMFADERNTPAARAAAARALVALKPDAYIPLLAKNLADTNQPVSLREKTALILAELNSPAAREATLAALPNAPRRLQIKLALSLAATRAGADALLTLAEHRQLPTQVLLDRAVRDRLTAAKPPQYRGRYEKLTVGVAPASTDLQRLINNRVAAFNPDVAMADRGRAVFEKSCAVCHQIHGQGTVVGPQLDGVGTRGLERVIEDVLDPNRNVDPAFRSVNVTLKDDTAVTGLLRREDGEVLVFADSTGKEVNVRKNEIAQRRESGLSVMPSNFSDVLSAKEFNDLLAFLLAQGAK